MRNEPRGCRRDALLDETAIENALVDPLAGFEPDADRDLYFERARLGVADTRDTRAAASSSYAFVGVREKYTTVRTHEPLLPFDLVVQGSFPDLGFGAFPLLRAPGPLEARVAYDDPCHLLHGQRIAEAPRALLRAIPGLDLFDLPGASDCCGAAGIYNLTQPETSERLLERKLDAIRQTRPDAVATGNPGCLMQLRAGAREAGLRAQVVHPVELLDLAHAAAAGSYS